MCDDMAITIHRPLAVGIVPSEWAGGSRGGDAATAVTHGMVVETHVESVWN
jgi:hypothetical protein